jgi:hypothetical protein
MTRSAFSGLNSDSLRAQHAFHRRRVRRLVVSPASHALRSSDRPHDRRRSTLAREKNTSRAEARRRSREQVRAQIAADEQEEEIEEAATDQPQPERRPLFKLPNVREDVRALPSILLSRRMLWLPPVLLVIGLALLLVGGALSPDVQNLVFYYIQFFFLPPALFTFFLAGFFAPRASYLVGLTYGLLAGVLWFIGYVPVTAVPDVGSFVGSLLLTVAWGATWGTLAAAFAGWYRDFLRGMQERGKQRRATREVDERTRRREERQEARKLAKQRPTT